MLLGFYRQAFFCVWNLAEFFEFSIRRRKTVEKEEKERRKDQILLLLVKGNNEESFEFRCSMYVEETFFLLFIPTGWLNKHLHVSEGSLNLIMLPVIKISLWAFVCLSKFECGHVSKSWNGFEFDKIRALTTQGTSTNKSKKRIIKRTK